MPLSNAERQKRYRERLKATARGTTDPVQVFNAFAEAMLADWIADIREAVSRGDTGDSIALAELEPMRDAARARTLLDLDAINDMVMRELGFLLERRVNDARGAARAEKGGRSSRTGRAGALAPPYS